MFGLAVDAPPIPSGMTESHTFYAWVLITIFGNLITLVPVLLVALRKNDQNAATRADNIVSQTTQAANVVADSATAQVRAVDAHLTGQLQNGIKARLDSIHQTVQAVAAQPTALESDTNAKVTDVQGKVSDLTAKAGN